MTATEGHGAAGGLEKGMEGQLSSSRGNQPALLPPCEEPRLPPPPSSCNGRPRGSASHSSRSRETWGWVEWDFWGTEHSKQILQSTSEFHPQLLPRAQRDEGYNFGEQLDRKMKSQGSFMDRWDCK